MKRFKSRHQINVWQSVIGLSNSIYVVSFLVIFVFFFFTSMYDKNWEFDWRKFDKEQRVFIEKIEDNLIEYCYGVGYFNQLKDVRKLDSLFNSSDKLKLLTYPNSYVKTVTYMSMLQGDMDDYEIWSRILSDTLLIESNRGCTFMVEFIGEYMLKNYSDEILIEDQLKQYNFSEIELNVLIRRHQIILDRKWEYMENYLLSYY